MSTTKLKVSSLAQQHLDLLSTRLGLRPNIICRLALGRSLSISESVRHLEPIDSAGNEFNRHTLTGEFDEIFEILICQHEGRKIGEDMYFPIFFRNHLERGIDSLYNEYQQINSPINFLLGLVK